MNDFNKAESKWAAVADALDELDAFQEERRKNAQVLMILKRMRELERMVEGITGEGTIYFREKLVAAREQLKMWNSPSAGPYNNDFDLLEDYIRVDWAKVRLGLADLEPNTETSISVTD